jgi:O-acetyl-ADP-ribose deacetylase (regulator of RNase III)
MDHILRYRIGESSYMELALGDITRQQTDAIVNAANSSLLGGGGVDGAIHRAAGPMLLSTTGGLLKAKYVIHTVGPVWQGGKYNEPQILENCYCHSMEEAERLGCASVSFPSIATGTYRYPVPAAAQIALRTVAELLHQPGQSVKMVRFVLFEQEVFNRYAEVLSTLGEHFPHFQIKEEPVSL